jgi:hypothetical protein
MLDQVGLFTLQLTLLVFRPWPQWASEKVLYISQFMLHTTFNYSPSSLFSLVVFYPDSPALVLSSISSSVLSRALFRPRNVRY